MAKKAVKKSNKIKWFLGLLAVMYGVHAACASYANRPSSDAYAMGRSIKILGKGGQCSGEQVESYSGHTYILSAAHCAKLADAAGYYTVFTEDGRKLQRRLIAEDSNSDLLLIEGVPGLQGLKIAESHWRFEHIRTLTHGAGMDTYKTEGALVQIMTISIAVGIVDASSLPCTDVKYRIVQEDLFAVCVLHIPEAVSTAKVSPGSSGGMVIDDDGALVAVVSASDEHFSYLVPLEAIRAFLIGY